MDPSVQLTIRAIWLQTNVISLAFNFSAGKMVLMIV